MATANTLSNIRTFCQMSTTVPSDAEITLWLLRIREVITIKFPSADTAAINFVECNVCKDIWDNRIQEPNQSPRYPKMKLLTPENVAILQPAQSADSGVDTLNANGKRYSELYTGRS